MKTNDLIKYFVQTFVKYMDQPKSERSQLKQKRKEEKEDLLFRWFGLVPFVVASELKKSKQKLHNRIRK